MCLFLIILSTLTTVCEALGVYYIFFEDNVKKGLGFVVSGIVILLIAYVIILIESHRKK